METKKHLSIYLSIYLIVIVNLPMLCGIRSVKAQSFTRITIGAIATDSSNSMDPAWADYDNDGDLDLFVCTSGRSATNPLGRNLLFLNNCNGEFSRVTAIPGGIVTDYTEPGPYPATYALCQQAAWADYDNDDYDLYVANRSGRNYFYRNNGDGTFTRLTEGPGVTDEKLTGAVSWADYNNDGYLDLLFSGAIKGTCDLFQNNGDGTFTEITEGDLVNVGTDAAVGGYTGLAWADFNNDGFIDVFITTAWDQVYYRNFLYINNGDGTFTNDTGNVVVNDPRITWSRVGINYSSAPADYDNDLDIDLFVQSEYTMDRYYTNNGDGQFTIVEESPLVSNYGIDNGGNAYGDYDNDGDLDLYVTNWGCQNFFYVNNGDGTFTQNTTEIIADEPDKAESYAAAWADYDNDGDLDLYVSNNWGAPSNYLYINIYENNGTPNHWFKINCKGVITNRDAVGARVYIKANINGNDLWQLREINCNSAKGAAGGGAVSGFVCHFGLGDAAVIDTLKIVWPASGITQVFTNVDADRFVRVFEDDNTIYEMRGCTADLPPKNPGFVKGMVYNDVDSNCVFDPGVDFYMTNNLIKSEDGIYYVFSDNQGEYEVRVPAGAYKVSQENVPNENIIPENCLNNDNYYLISVEEGEVVEGKDFANIVKGCELIVQIFPEYQTPYASPCPDVDQSYCASFINQGNPITSPTGPDPVQLVLEIDPLLQIDPASISSTCGCDNLYVIGNQVICEVPVFGMGECQICVDVSVPPLCDPPIVVPPGCIDWDFPLETSAYIIGKCIGVPLDPSDGAELVENANCSADPNDKLTVTPKGCGKRNNTGKNEAIIYKIRFQNTGTAPAYNIILRDVLDSDLDLSTLIILSASHNITRKEIIPDNALILTFENIMLPDSSADPEGSNGYVIFSIKPKAGLPDGTTITNQAGIYFDLNNVVLTNTTLNALWENPYPGADFETRHNCSNPGLSYDFTYTGGSENAAYLWNFGSDATPGTSTEQNPYNIVFSSTGTNLVTLIVDNNGCSA
ncbi:MAG: VCBS repeat-containing protein, partial [Bacteroidetes bacterium]|nr:VCBS repeat-containing protein [Bacteroidota bacterium]